jgi:NAD(P)-dependent dehydrogenase (short-subunit alcohol dehydrogenase family)
MFISVRCTWPGQAVAQKDERLTQRFSEKVAIVTGGSRGIGLEISKALAREEASVVITVDRPWNSQYNLSGWMRRGEHREKPTSRISPSDAIGRGRGM